MRVNVTAYGGALSFASNRAGRRASGRKGSPGAQPVRSAACDASPDRAPERRRPEARRVHFDAYRDARAGDQASTIVRIGRADAGSDVVDLAGRAAFISAA